MAGSNFDRSVSMQCSTCGGTQFEYEVETGPFRCAGCDRSFTREELMRENGGLIDNEVGEMAAEVGKHARDELRKSLRKALSGSKHFKLK
jgi:uncharacterized Zn finger protein (UPF0148 family)